MALDYVLNKDGSRGYRWNPVTGCKKELSICPIWEKCWARQIYNRFGHDFSPTFHEERLDVPMKKDDSSAFYVAYSGEMWGSWVPHGWIQDVMEVCSKTPEHRYLFLTKRPNRYLEYNNIERGRFTAEEPYPLVDNAMYGVTVNNWKNVHRMFMMQHLMKQTYASIEPVMDDLSPAIYGFKEERKPDWIIIGGWSGSKNEDIREYVEEITEACEERDIPVWHKDNLPYGWKDDNPIWDE